MKWLRWYVVPFSFLVKVDGVQVIITGRIGTFARMAIWLRLAETRLRSSLFSARSFRKN